MRATREVVRACGGRPVPIEKLHVTLLFVGSVDESRIPELEAIGLNAAKANPLVRAVSAESAAAPAAVRDAVPELIFDAVEFWKKPRILVATTSSEEPRIAAVLAGALQMEAQRAGFAPDQDASGLVPVRFRPHVTLARDVSRPKAEPHMERIVWSFKNFALVESKTEPQGSVYTVLQTFPISDLRP